VTESDVAQHLAAIEAQCRRRGVRLTVQRRAVLRAVLERSDHPTADQIFDAITRQMPGVSKTTVYRVLDALVELGLIGRLYHTGTPARFDRTTSRHHHLICMRCSKVIDLEPASDEKLPVAGEAPDGFEVEQFSVNFFGTCGRCRASTPER